MTSLQRLRIKIGVELGLLLLLLGVEHFVKVGLLDFEHNVAEHLNQAAIGVVGEARIVAALGQRFDALIIQAKVQNRIHHAGHGELRARANADQQRILAFAELLPLQLFQPCRASSICRSTSVDTALRAYIRGRLRSEW